jgi:hypothetical protein
VVPPAAAAASCTAACAFPRRIGRVTEAWLLCGFEPVGRCEGDRATPQHKRPAAPAPRAPGRGGENGGGNGANGGSSSISRASNFSWNRSDWVKKILVTPNLLKLKSCSLLSLAQSTSGCLRLTILGSILSSPNLIQPDLSHPDYARGLTMALLFPRKLVLGQICLVLGPIIQLIWSFNINHPHKVISGPITVSNIKGSIAYKYILGSFKRGTSNLHKF